MTNKAESRRAYEQRYKAAHGGMSRAQGRDTGLEYNDYGVPVASYDVDYAAAA